MAMFYYGTGERNTFIKITMTAVCVFTMSVIMVGYAAGHRAGGDNCCNGNKILDTIQTILKRGGHKGDNHDQFIAFSAYLGSHFTAKRNNVRLNFDKVETNYGNAYKDGIFTCPTNGLYAFDWTTLSLPGKTAKLVMVLNGRQLEYRTWAEGRSGTHGSASFPVVLQLKKGDRVWLIATHKQYGYFHSYYTAFRGMLMHKL